jgi:hypothetical protein
MLRRRKEADCTSSTWQRIDTRGGAGDHSRSCGTKTELRPSLRTSRAVDAWTASPSSRTKCSDRCIHSRDDVLVAMTASGRVRRAHREGR